MTYAWKRTICPARRVDSRTSLPIPTVIYKHVQQVNVKLPTVQACRRVLTSFNIFTFAAKPSRCSSFCPSKSSANRCPAGTCPYGEDLPDEGGVL